MREDWKLEMFGKCLEKSRKAQPIPAWFSEAAEAVQEQGLLMRLSREYRIKNKE